ncbi:MAG: hypothetical protein LM580_09695 [Thermofilum sp.]|nr:hypothetical protein [Thermofilum sp.]
MRVGGEGAGSPEPPARRIRELGLGLGSERARGSAPPGRRLPQRPERGVGGVEAGRNACPRRMSWTGEGRPATV